MDDIFEMFSGDYVDLSNLVVVRPARLHDTRWGSSLSTEPRQGSWGVACKFRFLKEDVNFYDYEHVVGNDEIDKRGVIFEKERQKLISAWKEYKEQD